MHNILFKIGNLTITGYGTMIAVGFLSAILLITYRAKKNNLSADFIYDLVFSAIIGGILGAKLLYIIVNIKEYIANPSLFLDIKHGFVVYGGIIGGIFTCLLTCKIKKQSFWDYFDLVMPSVFIAQGFGRIGCLLAGCCYGMKYDGIFSITFKNSSFAPNNIGLFPSQIFSSLYDFMSGVLLLILYNKSKNRNKGFIASMYLILYGVGRFIIEFFRGDLARGFVLVLSTSQFISIFVTISGIIILLLSKKKVIK